MISNNNSKINSQHQKKFKNNFALLINLILNSTFIKYFYSSFIISAAGTLLYYLHLHIGYQAVSLVFLFIISLMPLFNFKPGPIFLAALMSAFIWNYFFIPPSFTLRIGKLEDTLMFVLYFVVASVSGLLISRIRIQQVLINQREKRASALYDLTRDLSSSKNLDEVTQCSVKHLKETFRAEVAFIYNESNKKLKKIAHEYSTFKIDEAEWNIAQLVFLNSERVGRFTDTIRSITPATYFPLISKEDNLGVVGLLFPDDTTLNNDMEYLLDTFISQITIAIEREQLKESAKKNLIISESEKLYKTLFDSISHELKTPITTIIGAVSSLNDEKILSNREVLLNLLNEANIAANRLNRLVENLLDITRIESGNIKPNKEWHSIIDLINSVIEKIKPESSGHSINLEIQNDVGLLQFDYPLIEQALINIIRNSIEYTPANSTTDITVKRITGNIIILISDNGKGFPEEEIKNVFKKFYRVPGTKSGGTGLGLSIAKGFIEAHNGSITANNKRNGGAEFTILLPAN